MSMSVCTQTFEANLVVYIVRSYLIKENKAKKNLIATKPLKTFKTFANRNYLLQGNTSHKSYLLTLTVLYCLLTKVCLILKK